MSNILHIIWTVAMPLMVIIFLVPLILRIILNSQSENGKMRKEDTIDIIVKWWPRFWIAASLILIAAPFIAPDKGASYIACLTAGGILFFIDLYIWITNYQENEL